MARHSSLLRIPGKMPSALAIGVAVMVWLGLGGGDGASHAAKAKAKVRPPDLKILSVNPAPVPFVVNDQPLTLTIMVALPRTLPEEALLNVTTLITSQSKSSIRVLEIRQPLTDQALTDARLDDGDPRTIEVVQTWDGTDHTKHIVAEGVYDFQVQAKLMVASRNGPITKETSWKKRGTLEVRAR